MQNIFLTYANNSLREDPQNFLKIIEEIAYYDIGVTRQSDWEIDSDVQDFPGITVSGLLDVLIHAILSLGDNLEIAKEKVKGDWHTNIEYGSPDYKIAFEAAFGYQDGYCWSLFHEDGTKVAKSYVESLCATHCPERKTGLTTDLFEGPERLKCYECEQIYLIEVLKQIVAGVEYSEIPGFLTYIGTASKWIRNEVNFHEEKQASPFKQDIQVKIKWSNPLAIDHSGWKPGPDENFPYKHIFNELLRSIVSYALSDFLVNNDRRKLKICEECGCFYILKRLRFSRFCSDRCRLKWHNRQRIESGYMRDVQRKGRAEGKYQ